MRPDAGAGLPRRLRGVLGNAVLVVAALVAGWLLWPSSLGGCTTLTIVSGQSMEPTYSTGDLVVSRCGEPRVGDVMVYQPGSTGGARIIHRVIGGDEASGWELQGDNNDFVDPFTPRGEEVLGTARLHLPRVGIAAAALTSPVVWLSVIALAVALLVWPRRDEADDDAPDVTAADDGPTTTRAEEP
ncbi:signal peptidase I [Cellulomonas fimi]|uniref:Signal peptidase I n=1 Tax=Cellulomonas fimi TaxID=1708 RepID=A0A7Y0QGN5_CELFI|nr:signal peptidase I [Cellulomonas fimi]NMR20311.1 signal peptidase I [Cellulomonas fimi]